MEQPGGIDRQDRANRSRRQFFGAAAQQIGRPFEGLTIGDGLENLILQA
ncbi:MAG: hypothetical protein ACOH2M_16840 [Cypionkella sp.]